MLLRHCLQFSFIFTINIDVLMLLLLLSVVVQGELSSLGRLMMQGELEVWLDKKKERLPRQVFLYETCFLLCKKKRDETAPSTDGGCVYSFKSSIQVSNTHSHKSTSPPPRLFQWPFSTYTRVSWSSLVLFLHFLEISGTSILWVGFPANSVNALNET